jgi:hypothetical protein
LILAVLLITQFEIYERERWVRPAGEARSNNFHVLGKWLSGSGRPARFSPRWTGIKDIAPGEGGLFIQASLFDWEQEEILSWVQGGGSLVVSIDFPWYRSGPAEKPPAAVAALEAFLEKLGIRIRPPPGSADDPADMERIAAEEDGPAAAGEEPQIYPNYDRLIAFEEPSPTVQSGDSLVLRDKEGDIRLIRRSLGKGRIAVAGYCMFMYNYFLGEEVNARLAWELTGASLGDGRGILFVRGRRAAEGLFGILGERGNLPPLVLSCLVLVFVGFWTALPGFGIPLGEDPRRPPSIAGRFSVEARFLRRHDALEVYLKTYLRELRRRSRGREPGPEIQEVEAALAAGKRIGPRKTAVYLKNLMSALEHI